MLVGAGMLALVNQAQACEARAWYREAAASPTARVLGHGWREGRLSSQRQHVMIFSDAQSVDRLAIVCGADGRVRILLNEDRAVGLHGQAVSPNGTTLRFDRWEACGIYLSAETQDAQDARRWLEESGGKGFDLTMTYAHGPKTRRQRWPGAARSRTVIQQCLRHLGDQQ